MKFIITTADYEYKDEEYRRRLERIGFRFEKRSVHWNRGTFPGRKNTYLWGQVEEEVEYEINTLEELIDFIRDIAAPHRIVMDEKSIMIYDSYIE